MGTTLFHHRRPVLALFVLICAVAAAGLPRLAVETSVEAFLVRDAEALERYRDLQMTFGRDRALRLVLQGPGLWTREGLEWVGQLERRARELPGVLGAAGLWGHHATGLAQWPPADPGAWRSAVLRDRLDRGAGWVSPDGEVVTIWTVLYNLQPVQQRRTLEKLESLLARPPAGVAAELVGLPMIQHALDDEVATWTVRFLPLLLLLAVILLVLGFGGLTGALPPLLFVGLCETTVLGACGWLGVRFDVVTMVLLPLMLVIPLATAVHVSVRYRQLTSQGLGPETAVRETYREKGWPVLWAGVTTAAGFASLVTSAVPSVQVLGLGTALGVVWMTVAAFTFYPALLSGIRERRSRGNAADEGGRVARLSQALERRAPLLAPYESWSRRRGRAWAAWAVLHRRRVTVLFAAAGILFLAGLPLLRRESSVVTYLPPERPARARLEALQRRGVGTVAAHLVISAAAPQVGAPGNPTPGPFATTGGLERLARLAEELRAQSGVLGAVSGGDMWASEVEWSVPAGERSPARGEAALARLRQDPEKGLLLDALATRDGHRARVSLLLPMSGFQELEPVLRRAEAAARQSFPDAEVWTSGQYPLVLAAQQTLLSTTVVSLSLTLLVVVAVFLLLLRNGRLALAALAPNLFAVAAVLGAMGWLGVPLDSTTVMTAAVVLGLAVDDTLHTVGRFRHELERGAPAEAAVATLERVAPAHVLTSAVLALGFGVCGFSALVPVARFGALAALAMGLALVADLVLMPALLAGFKPSTGAAAAGSRRPPGAGPAPTDPRR